MIGILLALSAAIVTACGVSRPVEVDDSERAINTGYGKQVKRDITTSVSEVEIPKDANTYRTIYEMIQGRCPGVQVMGDRILIRGINSVNSTTDPLFVVDGQPVEDISHINHRAQGFRGLHLWQPWRQRRYPHYA